LAVGVCAVEFADGFAGVGDAAVGDVGCAGGAAGAVVAEVEGLDGGDAVEKILLRGACSAMWKGSSNWDERLLEVTYV